MIVFHEKQKGILFKIDRRCLFVVITKVRYNVLITTLHLELVSSLVVFLNGSLCSSVFLMFICFFRRPTKSSPVSNVGNTLLLCPHGGFMFTYDSLINGEAQQ